MITQWHNFMYSSAWVLSWCKVGAHLIACPLWPFCTFARCSGRIFIIMKDVGQEENKTMDLTEEGCRCGDQDFNDKTLGKRNVRLWK
jgi:hypothetical protein